MTLTQPSYAQQSLTFKLTTADGVLWSAAVDPDILIADVNSHGWVTSEHGYYAWWGVLRNPRQLGRTLGVHLYLRPWPSLAVGGVAPVEFAVRFSNGVVHPDGSGFPGSMYFKSLKIQFASLLGATISEERPHLGQSTASNQITIAADPGGGDTHVFPARWILERRGVIVPSGGNATTIHNAIFSKAGMADPAIAASVWGPAGIHLRKFTAFDLDSGMSDARVALAAKVASGASGQVALPNGDVVFDAHVAQVGPWFLDDYPDGGAPAGYGINVEPGWEVDTDAIEFSLMGHEANMGRNPVAAFDFTTGAAMSPKSWTNQFLSHSHPMGGEQYGAHGENELPAFLLNVGTDQITQYKRFNMADCSYEAALRAYWRHDPAHVIRAWRHAAVLAGYLGDAMASDDIIMLARNARHFGWGDRVDESPDSGGYTPQTLSLIKHDIDLNPGVGDGRLDRAFGHMLMLNAWAAYLGDVESIDFLKKALHVYVKSADSHGICQREYHQPYMPADVQGTQHFHTTLTHIGAFLAAACMDRVDHSIAPQLPGIVATLKQWMNEIMLNPALPYEMRYDNNAVSGPPKWIGTHTDTTGEVAVCTALSWGEDPAGPTGNNGFEEHCAAALASVALAVAYVNPADPDVKNAVDAAQGLGVPAIDNDHKLLDINPATGDSGDRSQWARWLAANALAYP